MNPQFDSIGRQFIQHYYNTFDANRSTLGPLYAEQSLLTFEGEQFQGSQSIVNKLVSLPFQKIKHELVRADCQPNPQNNGVIVFVVGKLFVDDSQAPLMFAQVFHLAPNPSGGFFCLNDMFRLNTC